MTKEKKNEKKKDGLNSVLMQVAISIISIVFAFLVGGIIIAVMGEFPGRDTAFREPWMTGNVQTMLSMSVCDEIYLY